MTTYVTTVDEMLNDLKAAAKPAVTREHRRIIAICYTGEPLSDWAVHWVETGRPPEPECGPFDAWDNAAQALADAEARGERRGREAADHWWRVRISTMLADRDLLLRTEARDIEKTRKTKRAS